MRKIVYYVATSLDGFISGPNSDISGFVGEGDGIARYLGDLENFDTVIMGRNTYEFGYKFGMKPGEPAYPQMTHYIFSNSLTFDKPDPKVHTRPLELEEINILKSDKGTGIYLCGGGKFAGWLLENGQIDILKVKLNPIVLGDGVRLFGDSKTDFRLELMDTERFEKGLQIMTYRLGGRIRQ